MAYFSNIADIFQFCWLNLHKNKKVQYSFEFLQYLGQCITLSISRAQAQLMFVKWNCKHDAYTIYDASFSIKRNRDQRHCFAVDSRQDWGVPQQWRRQQCQSFLFCCCGYHPFNLHHDFSRAPPELFFGQLLPGFFQGGSLKKNWVSYL